GSAVSGRRSACVLSGRRSLRGLAGAAKRHAQLEQRSLVEPGRFRLVDTQLGGGLLGGHGVVTPNPQSALHHSNGLRLEVAEELRELLRCGLRCGRALLGGLLTLRFGALTALLGGRLLTGAALALGAATGGHRCFARS